MKRKVSKKAQKFYSSVFLQDKEIEAAFGTIHFFLNIQKSDNFLH